MKKATKRTVDNRQKMIPKIVNKRPILLSLNTGVKNKLLSNHTSK